MPEARSAAEKEEEEDGGGGGGERGRQEMLEKERENEQLHR